MEKEKKAIFVEYCAKDFLDGTQQLDPLSELAYRRICDMIYATDDRLLDDDSVLQYSTKTGAKWKKIKDDLIHKHLKIYIQNGFIRQKVCTEKLEKSWGKIAQSSAAGKSSAEKRKLLKNKDTGSTGVASPLKKNAQNLQPTKDPKTQYSDNKLSESSSPALKRPEISAPEIQMAVSLFNEMASKVGMQQVLKISSARSSMLRTRLTECGGLEGWEKYLSIICSTPFLHGSNARGWQANFDLIIKEQNFIKICEGYYKGRTPKNVPAKLTRSEQLELERREAVEILNAQYEAEEE